MLPCPGPPASVCDFLVTGTLAAVGEDVDQPSNDGESTGHWLATTGAAIGAGVAGTHMSPDQGAAMAAAAPAVADLFFTKLGAWRAPHVNRVVTDAVAEAELPVEVLLDRVLADELRGGLAPRVLLAAQDAGTDERLRALSRSLARGALADDEAEVRAEMLYARALADLDSPHVHVLALFDKTWRELGLSDHDTYPAEGLGYHEVVTAAKLGSVLDPVLGVLAQHGLMEERHGSGPTTFDGGGPASRGHCAYASPKASPSRTASTGRSPASSARPRPTVHARPWTSPTRMVSRRNASTGG
jgi:hypothetical protein